MSDGTPNCGFFKPSDTEGVAVCLAGLFGGLPSLGTCNRCERNPSRGQFVRVTTSAWPADPLAAIPLPGDVVAAIAKVTGAAKLAKLVERVLGKPCGCAERQAKLNALGARLLARWRAGRYGPAETPRPGTGPSTPST